MSKDIYSGFIHGRSKKYQDIGILASMIMDNIVINFDLLLERGNNLVIYTKVKCCVAYR